MAIKSFCTPVKLMACVATIPGPGAACLRKNRYPPTLIAATISKLNNPFMTQLYASTYLVRRWPSRMCGSGQPLPWIVSDHPSRWNGCVSETVAVGRQVNFQSQPQRDELDLPLISTLRSTYRASLTLSQ